MVQEPATQVDGSSGPGAEPPAARTRRGVLLGAGLVGAAGLAAACGGSDDPAPDPGAGAGSGNAQTPAGEAGGQALAKTSDIPVGGGKIFKDQKVVVTQPAEGQFKAFSAICTHRRCSVESVSGGTINCPCHGSKFKIADGSVAQGPAESPLEEKKTTVQGDQITLA